MSTVELNTPMGEEGLCTVNFFRRRLAELESNWTELENEGFSVSEWVGRDSDGKVSISAAPVSVHRLKGLYMDFRFFWGKKESSHFDKIQKLIGKHCNKTEVVKECLKENKKQWERAGAGETWHGLATDKIISVIFYGSIMHERDDHQATLKRINEMLTEPAIHHFLASAIWEKTFPLRNLRWMLEPLSADNQAIQVLDTLSFPRGNADSGSR